MIYEDFFTFFYPTLFILGGLLCSIPAYIALRMGKNFWVWWFGTTAFFSIILFVLMRVQAISLLIYSLLILPVTSVIAVLPNIRTPALPAPLVGVINACSRLKRNKDVRIFRIILFSGAILYCSLIFINWDSLDRINEVYFITSGVITLIACLGFTSFVIGVSEKTTKEIVASALLVLFLATPIFLKPSRAYDVGFLLGRVISNGIYIGPVITDLMYSDPIAGIFVLLGLCSGCVAIAVVLNDRYKIFEKIVTNLPLVQLSNNPPHPFYILGGAILYGRFVYTFNLGEAGIFLWPLYYICVGFPMILISFAGIVLSSVAIAKSISQNKSLYAVEILFCGLIASWQGDSRNFLVDYFGLPGTLLMSYGIGSGFAALILWIISDYRDRYYDSSQINSSV
jgi:hypothetical protein